MSNECLMSLTGQITLTNVPHKIATVEYTDTEDGTTYIVILQYENLAYVAGQYTLDNIIHVRIINTETGDTVNYPERAAVYILKMIQSYSTTHFLDSNVQG